MILKISRKNQSTPTKHLKVNNKVTIKAEIANLLAEIFPENFQTRKPEIQKYQKRIGKIQAQILIR